MLLPLLHLDFSLQNLVADLQFNHISVFLSKFTSIMTKKQRAEIVMRELEKLYPEVPIPLDHKDPYTLLVAVALSAQSTDKKVNQITPKLFEVADTPEKNGKIRCC
ncbi:hypothetical protein BPO_1263 [Bergeyella porcorum]|uniref:Endonuclease III n=1 Tax=Bergeyella porcorum TaxID=1735111 RepID=A0AAU0F2F2_9FLAO